MAAAYQLTATSAGVIRSADHAYIPNAQDNRDWRNYQAWLTAGGVPDPYVVPPKTTQQQAEEYLAAGLTVSYSKAPSLNGTYGVVNPDNLTLNAILTGLANGSGLPNGKSTVEIFDLQKKKHNFTSQQVTSLIVAVRDFIHNSRLYGDGVNPALPPNSVSL